MLCIVSPDMGKQFHQWIPQLSNKISELKTNSKSKDFSDYLSKIYNTADTVSIRELSTQLSTEQNKKYRLAQLFPSMKLIDIEILSKHVTDEELAEYEQQCGK